MRILFTLAGGSGHLEPLLPLARAARARGHTVAFSARPWMVPKIEALRFEAFGAGPDAGLTPVRKPLAPVDLAADLRRIGTGFGRRVTSSRAAELVPVCQAWRPDVMVCEEVDYGGMVA